jgi:SprT-like family
MARGSGVKELPPAKGGRDKQQEQSHSYEQKPEAITPVEYGGLQAAYDHLNRTLFDGALIDVLITLQRHAHSAGHFVPNRYTGRVESSLDRHELNLNPDAFYGRDDEWICSVLTHEMVHVWHQQFGTPPSRGYHDKVWGKKMKEVGLYPSNTGAVGGRETGTRMQHYILEGGAFSRTFAELKATGWRLNLQSAQRPGQRPKGPNSKTKFTCPRCAQNAWGKPDLGILCTSCLRMAMEAVGTSAAVLAVLDDARMISEPRGNQSYDQAA